VAVDTYNPDMTRTQIRIVAGSLRGRTLSVDVHPGLRPTPHRVRESLFNILGQAVPDRPFYDIFAGTGVNGLEALSRGATRAVFIERDTRLALAIEASLKLFRVADRGQVIRGDVYRWADRWRPPAEPVNLYLSPPFPDLTERPEEFRRLIETLQAGSPVGSVLTVQIETGYDEALLPDLERWDIRVYGRNVLAFWEPPDAAPESAPAEPPADA
jgi:16S rRNA (guanine(966)-N(2))-methyltransferase RsmD